MTKRSRRSSQLVTVVFLFSLGMFGVLYGASFLTPVSAVAYVVLLLGLACTASHYAYVGLLRRLRRVADGEVPKGEGLKAGHFAVISVGSLSGIALFRMFEVDAVISGLSGVVLLIGASVVLAGLNSGVDIPVRPRVKRS
jgi:hypothetical protein